MNHDKVACDAVFLWGFDTFNSIRVIYMIYMHSTDDNGDDKNERLQLTHVDNMTSMAHMVNIAAKIPQKRYAHASGKIMVAPATLQLIITNNIKKGAVLTVAQVAGIQAAKATAQLIPLCHTLQLDCVELELNIVDDGVVATSQVHCTGRTGAEMEALTAVSVALLTIYDMCKAVDKNMQITAISLLEKSKHD